MGVPIAAPDGNRYDAFGSRLQSDPGGATQDGYEKDIFGNQKETDTTRWAREAKASKAARDAAGIKDVSDGGTDVAANFEGSANGVVLANAATTNQTQDATGAMLQKQKPVNTGSRRGSFLTGPGGNTDMTLGTQPALGAGTTKAEKKDLPGFGGMTADDLTNFLRTRGW